MRLSESDPEPWRPSWPLTVIVLTIAAAIDAGVWAFGGSSFEYWGAGLISGIALCGLMMRMEGANISAPPRSMARDP